MKIALVGRHLPLAEGSATGRAFWALGEGLVAEGHDVVGWAWRPEAPSSHDELPPWCEWRPLPPEPWLRTKAWAAVRPRHDVGRTGWRAPDGYVGVADESISWPAVAHARANAVTFHYLTALDGPAVGRRPTPRDRQDLRFERRAAARAGVVLAYSGRVARAIDPGRAVVVPIAQPVPTTVPAPVDQPVAVMLADWRWAPNVVALDQLLRSWPAVRDQVPGARLLLGGRHLATAGVGTMPGVEQVGEVAAVVDLLAQAAVLAFPCPPSSGPKVKVLDALANGVPVVTTPAGIEGLHLGAVVAGRCAGAWVADDGAFGAALVTALRDPAGRAELGAAGRAAVETSHAPVPAARARVDALRRALGRAAGEGR